MISGRTRPSSASSSRRWTRAASTRRAAPSRVRPRSAAEPSGSAASRWGQKPGGGMTASPGWDGEYRILRVVRPSPSTRRRSPRSSVSCVGAVAPGNVSATAAGLRGHRHRPSAGTSSSPGAGAR
ncbi:hypothetical protein ACFQY7_52695 [Actinomadura luteofluorescens]|uniref:hypothetical protein n=1 Tax=Actinomadura luteofluorescens TaxID=46163 RepID=UPI003629D177